MSSSTSSYLETTYSQDERIEHQLKISRQKEDLEQSEIELHRERYFNYIFTSKSHDIFKLKGLHFVYVNHVKIKFYYKPSELVKYVNSNVKFYCRLMYHKKYRWWSLKSDSFPANYKLRIYSLFNTDIYVNDEEIWENIFRIYKILVKWSKQEEVHRIEKYEKYRRGLLEDLDLDADDLEIFFDEHQKREFMAKRISILKRMIVPKRRRGHRKRIRISPKDNSNDSYDYSI
ncbi:uncharacterized protein LOC130449650 [Diorhabda sublineata]|uniref:uncharacterized protein LOC130449650 n=1 Tax=Diorhabda sublineata TaxID=1163346 RepID=UPI0024E12C25|nr:uncharacterized protein LOC130449650 [Diorhabda sublineata]